MQTKSINNEFRHADSCLEAARVTLEAGIVDACFNRLYYTVFHAARALILSKDLETKSHEGVYTFLSKEFIKPGIISKSENEMYQALIDMRATADYGYFTDLSIADANVFLPQAEAFLAKAKSLLGFST